MSVNTLPFSSLDGDAAWARNSIAKHATMAVKLRYRGSHFIVCFIMD